MRILSGHATRTDLLKATFDQVQHEMVVLDAEGAVVMVNEPFLRFGRDNGWAHPEDAIGTNYLTMCAAAARAGDPDAGRVAFALTNMLNGQRETYRTIYRCDSPLQARWFRLSLSPWASEGETGVIMVHENITAEMQAERAVQRAATGWEPQDVTQSPIRLQERLDALAWRLQETTGDKFAVDGSADLVVVTAPEIFLTALARLLTASPSRPDHFVLLRGQAAGRNVILSIYGLRSVDQAALEALRNVPGRCDAEAAPTPRGWQVDITLRRARRPEA